MNDYDNQVLGVGNSMHPANQPEAEAEAEKVTHTEFLENELNQTYFKDFLSDYKDTVTTIHQTWKRIAEIEENQRILPFDSDEQQELIQLKKKLTTLIELL